MMQVNKKIIYIFIDTNIDVYPNIGDVDQHFLINSVVWE